MFKFKPVKPLCEVDWDWPSDTVPSKPTFFRLGRGSKIGRMKIGQPASYKQIIQILLILLEENVDQNGPDKRKAERGNHLLTQEEAADRLRCSVSNVKRLRLTGKLKYIPGRPTLIHVDDLDEFERKAAKFKLQNEETIARPSPSPEEQARIDAAARARRVLLLKKIAGPIKRTPLTDEEKARREAFRQDQRKKRQRAVLRRAAKVLKKPKTS
ncbi:helix-turn-helix domain-containing protein [Methylobacterium sp. Leaf117]|uniref:helix-turn-helix domain-containing protein n=1 Tax=Methylobacterium sp. Leaf117 TaxID=1736260 RepID=UPI00138F1527|nr:helix-turn-helix domain-containing protein [Methylobacterium sp. Leaf117]